MPNIPFKACTRATLLSLPERDWDRTTVYDSIAVWGSSSNHESGWSKMYVVGINAGIPVELISSCSDDIRWDFTVCGGWRNLSTDCAPKSKAIHFWSNNFKFKAGLALSSLDITLVEKKKP